MTQSDDLHVRSVRWLLTKILGDDVVTGDHRDPQLGQGTAPGRIISVTDPEMRHGHKSKAQRFDGFKTAVATEVETELILDIADLPAFHGDGEHLMPTVARVEEHAAISVERVIGDGAYPAGPNLAACATHVPAPIDLVGPLARPADPAVAKSGFRIGLTRNEQSAPKGARLTERWHARIGGPLSSSDLRARPVRRVACSLAVCTARWPVGRSRRTTTRRIDKGRVSARKRRSSASCIGSGVASNGSKPR